MNAIYSQIFEDYNKLIENTYNELMTSTSEEAFSFPDDNLIRAKLNDKQIPWQKEVKSYLDDQTPEQYFSTFKDPEKLMEIFKQAAVLCDKDIPNALADVLSNSGKDIDERLLSIVQDKEYRRDTDNVVIAAAALYVLGRTGNSDILKKLLELLKDCTKQDDLLMESITDAVKQYGSKALDTVMDYIERQDFIDFRIEYMIMILPEISTENRSEKVYKLLKSSFLRMENKILGASALADYGDGRAVTVLRGYIEKNLQAIDKETFYELKKSIETLGGSTEDLILPNMDDKTYGKFL